jgi:Fe-S cluster biogenesis protein NfuA
VELLEVKRNDVYVRMGGGCQGCSSASATLRQGVEQLIRERVPAVGAIFDTTDHAAGRNPYYTG